MTNSHPSTPANSRDPRLVLILIFLFALFLRFWGASFGLPFSYQVSENMYIAAAQAAEVEGIANLQPLFGIYQLVLVIERAVLKLLLPVLDGIGLPTQLAATIQSFEMSFNLLGRWTSALLGALSIFSFQLETSNRLRLVPASISNFLGDTQNAR